MQRKKFYILLKKFGEFKCKINKNKLKKININADIMVAEKCYHSNTHHYCNFIILGNNKIDNYGYQRKILKHKNYVRLLSNHHITHRNKIR